MTTQHAPSYAPGDATHGPRCGVRLPAVHGTAAHGTAQAAAHGTAQAAAHGLALSRAAEEMGLKSGELALAVQLGKVRSTADASGGPPRIARSEIDRLRAAEGFPDTLRERVRTVGTSEAAELLAISRHRFTGLARTGHFVPVRLCLNRYHAVVWLYLACELRDFAHDHAELLTGRMPPAVRAALEAGEDRRPRNWRGRKLGLLLRSTADPWVRAAAVAAMLDPVSLAEVVPDPYERSHLRVLRPDLLPGGRPQSPAGRDLVDRLLRADHPDEILWHRVSLADAVREARRAGPAPRPGPAAGPTAESPDGPSGAVAPVGLPRPAGRRARHAAPGRKTRRPSPLPLPLPLPRRTPAPSSTAFAAAIGSPRRERGSPGGGRAAPGHRTRLAGDDGRRMKLDCGPA
ncbi:DUF6397 family protein [Streptomyces sp. NPDC049597]|uniref:DUF6397 family protein n=1 Tax=Streptomyces sp. NPDC049597 TaxID=3155276 RepID=UPI0034360E71